jgi:hypothetical protein
MNDVLHVRPIIGKAGAEKLRAASGLSLLESRVVFQLCSNPVWYSNQQSSGVGKSSPRVILYESPAVVQTRGYCMSKRQDLVQSLA